MKPTYEKADAEVVLFDNGDVITTSGENTYCFPGGFDNPGSGCQDGAHDGRFQ